MAKTKKEALIKVKLVRSLCSCKEDQIATANSLGLRRIGDESVQPDNEATKGKVKKIAHLVSVAEAK